MARKTKETENPKENIVKEVAKKIKETVVKTKDSNKSKAKSTLKKEKKNPEKTNKKTSIKNEKSEEKIAKTTTGKKSLASKSKTLVKEKTTAKKSTKAPSSATKKATAKTSQKSVSVANKTTVPKAKKVDYDALIKKDYSPEYYDMPYRYNQTVVKILAQTPSKLFVYWDISDEDRENLKKHFGKYVFEITKPVLIIHNKTMHYSFEIDIDDFANSWYLPIQDSNCDYQIELGRRPIPVNYNYIPGYDIEKNGPIEQIDTPYIYISSSNELEAPNDRILFNNTSKIYFRDVKTNKVIEKDIKEFPFINKDNEFISIYQIYQDLFKDVLSGEDFRYLDLTNPSSGGNPSSGSLSSR